MICFAMYMSEGKLPRVQSIAGCDYDRPKSRMFYREQEGSSSEADLAGSFMTWVMHSRTGPVPLGGIAAEFDYDLLREVYDRINFLFMESAIPYVSLAEECSKRKDISVSSPAQISKLLKLKAPPPFKRPHLVAPWIVSGFRAIEFVPEVAALPKS